MLILFFQNFQKMIPKSVVGNLTTDSSNIITLIQDAYNDLKGQVCQIYQVCNKTGIAIK